MDGPVSVDSLDDASNMRIFPCNLPRMGGQPTRKDAHRHAQHGKIEGARGARSLSRRPDHILVPQTAKILNKSIRWVLEKTSNGKLRSVWLDGRKGINRVVLIEAITEGIEK